MNGGDQVLTENRDQDEGRLDLVASTVDIVAAYVSNNRVPPAEMPALLSSVHAAVSGLGSPEAVVESGPEKPTPAQTADPSSPTR